MKDNNSVSLKTLLENPLEAVLKQGARELVSAAIDAKLGSLLEQYDYLTPVGKQVVVRDRSNQCIKFNSLLVPPYLNAPKTWKSLSPGCI